MITLYLLLAIPLALYSIYLISIRKYRYWEKKKVPHIPPKLILGNFSEHILQKKYLGRVEQELCKMFPEEPYVGSYLGTEPTLIIQDPELIKAVMTKDYYFFSGRETSNYSEKELATRNLFLSSGDKWKVQRQNLTPLFSSAKMKNMFHLVEKCARVFETLIDQEVQKGKDIEVKALIGKFTMDSIGNCAFGVETRTMVKTENNPFTEIGNVIFDTNWYRAFKLVARGIWPAIFYGLGFKSQPVDVDNFFTNLMTETFKGRDYKPTTRHDFVDLMLKLYNQKTVTGDSMSNRNGDASKKVTLEIDDEFLISQCFLFFAAGFETSATTLSHTLLELAKNPEAQELAFQDVDNYMRRNDNVLKYECVTELPYVEACVNEALRLYPVLGVITREVIEDYTFSTGLKLEKGLRVHLPVYHMQHNPKYFPEPEQFRPERFLGDAKQNIIPYTYFPFGEGPRLCIGMRFAKMQITAGIITLLKKYRVELAPGMNEKVDFEPRSVITALIGGIQLKFVPREGWEQRLFKAAS
ncbi:cytochrome P450 6B5-like [Spodoptera litura]|uniref:unspecific monooxygenase n=1 Tax=Spodoptera litura TaxID=69820 RepID=A0A9J7IQ94_SPOLT|nr:cytochrome P450 6B5-like [Spodoptera litura]UAC15941.1 cytochrome P450 CYP6AE68 [Spodoptera litura]